MNQVQLIGRLARDHQVKNVGEGMTVLHNAVALNRTKKDGSKHVDFIPITAWNKRATLMEKYLKKGDEIGIVGQLNTQQYENKNGQKVHIVEVVVTDLTFLRKKQENNLTLEDLMPAES